MINRETYPVKGRMIWMYNNDGAIAHWDIDYDDIDREMHYFPIYDLIDDGDTWLELCKEFKVEVNWANK